MILTAVVLELTSFAPAAADSPLVMSWRSALLGMVVVCTAISLAYLYLRDIERTAVGWLVAFVCCVWLSSVPMIIGFAGAYDRWPGLTFLPTQLSLCFGPLLYLHARSLMYGTLPARWGWLLAPAGAYWVYQLCAFTLLGDYRNKWAFNDAIHEPWVEPLAFWLAAGLAVWALAAIWRMRGRYLAWLAQNRSDDDTFRPVWLTHFACIGVPLALIWGLEFVLGRLFDLDYFDRFWADFSALFLVFMLAVEALARIQEPFPKAVDAPSGAGEPMEAPRRDWSEEGRRLRAAMVEHAWHLEPGLSLQDLARRSGSNQSYVSRALNQGLGLSFSEFVNGLRVDHARSLIEAGDSALLEIALASGFGSKASFNRAFRQLAGLTPSQYRQQVRVAGATSQNA